MAVIAALPQRQRVADLIEARLRELDLTATALRNRHKLNPAAWERLRHPRDRPGLRNLRARTLDKVDTALGWELGTLQRMLVPGAVPELVLSGRPWMLIGPDAERVNELIDRITDEQALQVYDLVSAIAMALLKGYR